MPEVSATVSVDPEQVARDALDGLQAAVIAKDDERSLALFTSDGMLIGSSVDETAFGATALRDFFGAVHASSTTIEWEWD